MTEDFEPIDHGVRSNESSFGAFDDSSLEEWRAKPPSPAPGEHRVAAQWLPLTIGIVDTEELLQKVQELRAEAYGHHLPEYAAKFSKPDRMDRLASMSILYAKEKDTGRIVGTARLQTNLFGPMQIESSLELPRERWGDLLCEVTRLAVKPGSSQVVRWSLLKAIHLFCISNQISGIVVGSRRSLLRQYLNLGFRCLYGDDRMVPLAHGSNLAHRILYLNTVSLEGEFRARAHPYHQFVFQTYHPDIHVFDSVLEHSSRSLGLDDDRAYNSKAA